MSMEIKKTLIDRFAEPLAENHVRRIVFWYDPGQEFAELVDEYCPEGVKLLKLTGNNNFAAKQLLAEVDTESDYLVYDPLDHSDSRDNWLLDIALASEEFRADLLSIRMQSLGVTNTPKMRRLMKTYDKFFENKERIAKLMAFGSQYDAPLQLHLDILAVLCGTSDNTAAGVIRALLMDSMELDENEAFAAVHKFGKEEVLWEMIRSYTGYAFSGDKTLLLLAAHILLTTLSVTMQQEHLKGLEQFISEPHQQHCYAMIDEWMHSEDDNALYEIASDVEEELHLEQRFDAMDVADLVNSECFPCINECILRHYMTEISESVIKADAIMETVEKRRTLKWFKQVRYYYLGLQYAAQMQQFYQENIGGFHVADHKLLWKEYSEKYYMMDTYYRKFHMAFSFSLKESSTDIEDLYKGVAEYVEGLYKNWYLAQLGGQWTTLTEEDLAKDARLPGIQQQSAFYSTFVRSVLDNNNRAYVIISDALRYEVAAELSEQLTKEMKGTATTNAVQAIFPSATKFGMAALLPHTTLSLTEDVKVLCDGLSTEGTANREKVLNQFADSVAITYSEFIKMKKAERRDLVNGKSVVYIYHNSIDAIGDKAVTENQVFEACEDAITQIKTLVRAIVNDLSGSNIFVTADHGFLYSYKPLEESDKAEKSLVNGNILELDRRYVIAEQGSTSDFLMPIPLIEYGSDNCGFAPREYIRMKKQGGGMNYVHGGVSLQELMVPVVEYKNVRATSKKFVDVTKAGLKLLSQSRKVTNNFFSLDFYQPDAVGGKIEAATYSVYMADVVGQPVSDMKKIIADKTSVNAEDRTFRVRFTLKGAAFDKTDTYYLTIMEEGVGIPVEKIEFAIDIAFVNDFDF